MDESNEEKILAHNLLSAASRHDVNAVKILLSKVSANVQDNSKGYTPLHAAIAAYSEGDRESTASGSEIEIVKVVELLLQNGAIWNDLDRDDETPGCIAHRKGLRKVYQLLVDAGVRAELLLSKLDEIDGPALEDEESEKQVGKPDYKHVEDEAPLREPKISDQNLDEEKMPKSDKSDQANRFPPPDDYIDRWNSNAEFLRSSLRYTDTTLLDHSSNAVMMDWETEIMKRHADTLLPVKGLRAMNIGHGMGIVDTAIQAHEPAEHHIVEAHPIVLEQMRKNGWFDKPGVTIHQGRWQDVLPKLAEQGIVLDAIYYDTFAEDYKDLREVFSEHVVGLLDESGRFSFYNGMGADRLISYDVYQGVVEIDLSEAGFRTEWENISVPKVDWKGVRRPYWNVEVYRLPICYFA